MMIAAAEISAILEVFTLKKRTSFVTLFDLLFHVIKRFGSTKILRLIQSNPHTYKVLISLQKAESGINVWLSQ